MKKFIFGQVSLGLGWVDWAGQNDSPLPTTPARLGFLQAPIPEGKGVYPAGLYGSPSVGSVYGPPVAVRVEEPESLGRRRSSKDSAPPAPSKFLQSAQDEQLFLGSYP
jgi:hypothetical protein